MSAEGYYQAVTDLGDSLQDALSDLTTREDRGELTVREAADERIRLLEEHLAACRDLNGRYLGGDQAVSSQPR